MPNPATEDNTITLSFKYDFPEIPATKPFSAPFGLFRGKSTQVPFHE
jgi:hypothetical protein